MPSTGKAAWGKVGSAFVWILVVVELLGMGLAGASKFLNPALWTELFVGWGYPPWFAFAVGGAEVLGALLLLVPRLSSYAASLLLAIMMGALGTVLAHPGRMGPTTPTVHLVVLSLILVARWKTRWVPGTLANR